MRVDSSNFNPYTSTNSNKILRPQGIAESEEIKPPSTRKATVDYVLREVERADLDPRFISYSAGISNTTGQLSIGFGTSSCSGYSVGSVRDDWDGFSKEKPESFSHVPNQLWDAFVNSYEEGEMIWDACLLDIPKWDIGLHRQPPELHNMEVDDEKMLSYDYLGVIDTWIDGNTVFFDCKDVSPESNQKAVDRYEKRMEFLHTLRENVASVLQPPLHSNSDKESDSLAYHRLYSDVGEELLDERYENQVVGYELKLRMKTVDAMMQKKGISEEYKSQLLSKMDKNESMLNEGAEQFRNYLLKSGSNMYDSLEVSPDITEVWYTDFLEEHIGKLIDEMGSVNTPEGKWDVPILWEMRMAKEAQEASENQTDVTEAKLQSEMVEKIISPEGVFAEERFKVIDALKDDTE